MTSLAMLSSGGGAPIRQTKLAPDGVELSEDVSEPHFARVGLPDQILLPDKGFPSEFLGHWLLGLPHEAGSLRSWPIGQTRPVKAVFMSYWNTLQADPVKLVAKEL